MTNNERLEQFTRDCKIINLKHEYEGYKEDIQWAIITELTEEELNQKYPEEVQAYIPFIRLSISQGEVFEDSERYEAKHRMRAIRCGHNFDITDEAFERHHPELLVYSIEDETIKKEDTEKLKEALSTLSESQRNRIYKYYFLQMSYSQIAREEGVKHTSVKESIEVAIKKLKTFFAKHPTI